MVKDTIYLKSGDAFIIMWEDSVEIVQPDGNSIITRRLEKNKSSIELIKRTPDEVKEIAERYEKSRQNVNNMIPQFKQLPNVNNAIPQFKQPLNTMTPKKTEDITITNRVPKFHQINGDYMAEAWELELGQKVIRIKEEL